MNGLLTFLLTAVLITISTILRTQKSLKSGHVEKAKKSNITSLVFCSTIVIGILVKIFLT
ncbi:MAG: hypothetical protein CMD01_03485 [Flavobacteriales bacterium]|nr:hypothetical protein [Flavobacteriales bacterium]